MPEFFPVTNKIPVVLCSIVVACFVLVMVPRHVRSIQLDLAQRSESALAKQAVGARVEVRGREVVLSGEVASPEVLELATTIVEDVWGVRAVANRLSVSGADRLAAFTTPPEMARPLAAPTRSKRSAGPPALRVYVELGADRNLKLSGSAPSTEVKDAWLAEALSLDSSRTLQDRLEILAPDDAESTDGSGIEAAVLEGLALLHRLDEGRLSVTSSRVRLSGKASDPELESEIQKRLLAVLPHGFRVSVDLRVEDDAALAVGTQETMVLRLLLSRGRDDAVIISGVAPGESAKAGWLARATKDYSPERIRDRLQVRDVAVPPHYGECMLRALPWLGKLIDGRIEISPGHARVTGKIDVAADSERLRAELAEAGCVADFARLVVRQKAS